MFNLLKLTSIVSMFMLAIQINIWAQEPPMVSYSGHYVEKLENDCFALDIFYDISPGIHIQSNEPDDGFLIPTEFSLNGIPCVIVEEINYSKPELIKLDDQSMPTGIFKDALHIRVIFSINCQAEAHYLPLNAELSYQACNKQKCYFPRTLTTELGTKGRSEISGMK